MTQAELIISRFGTQERLAAAIGVRQSVIAGWKKRGFVPAQQQSRVLEAAHREGLQLSPGDFFSATGTDRETAA